MIYYLPKGYLSWSQMSLWEESPQKYIDYYIDGKERFETKEMRAGKMFSVAAQQKESDDPKFNKILRRLPRREFSESELLVDFEGIPLYMIFDSADRLGFEEYKTGKTPWTHHRAYNHGQMMFYSLGFYLEVKALPEAHLHWLPMVEKDSKLFLTGQIKTFNIRYSQVRLLKFGKRIHTIAEQITNYEQYRKKVVRI